MNITEIDTVIETVGQYPVDKKIYVKELAELKELGADNFKAFRYYEDMKVQCIETHRPYIWREELFENEMGLINESFTYPLDSITNGIDYSNRTFNFFIDQIVNDIQLNRLKDLVYQNLEQSLSVSPTFFERGVETDLVFTWKVDKKDDNLIATTLNNDHLTNEATGVYRTYTLLNQTASKTISLISDVIRNNLSGGEFQITNTVTSISLIPQFVGKYSFSPSNYNSFDVDELKNNFTLKLQSNSNIEFTETYTGQRAWVIINKENPTIKSGNDFVLTIGELFSDAYWIKYTTEIVLENGDTETAYLFITQDGIGTANVPVTATFKIS